jgi:DNA mismatch repair protein MutL
VIPPYEHREPSPPAESVPPAPGTGEGFEGAGGDNRSPVSQRPEAEAGDRFQRAFNYPYERVPFPSFPGAVDHRALKIRADLLLGAPTDPSPTPFHSQGVRILGQIHESYIIACDHHGLLIVDQHVAHERVLYERFSTAMEEGKVESQGLVVPKTMELLPHQVAILERALPELHRSGFTVERFGGKSILIRSVPVAAKDQDCANLFSEILEGLEAEERTLDLAKIRDRIAVNMACRAAIKVHTPLSIEKMQWLLDELSQTRIPTNCPHGRPVLLRFSLYEIERNFGRI